MDPVTVSWAVVFVISLVLNFAQTMTLLLKSASSSAS
ncbi:hypothetical protein X471_00760 [Bartonella bacilliformis str. Heidi Mejia]|nr:hypothetical protein X471_00760 [Bartonella bacilliformis str. Heidi Mejia]KEG19540.1 hypothetical protein H707_00192 [Bartonella bacilliformis Hosp800-02]KEG24886.1 hypothetical protein H706_00200 [Bartonella bacilliformis CAR600-02]